MGVRVFDEPAAMTAEDVKALIGYARTAMRIGDPRNLCLARIAREKIGKWRTSRPAATVDPDVDAFLGG